MSAQHQPTAHHQPTALWKGKLQRLERVSGRGGRGAGILLLLRCFLCLRYYVCEAPLVRDNCPLGCVDEFSLSLLYLVPPVPQ